MAKVMISVPDQLFSRMKATIPSRERSKIIAILLETEIKNRENNLFLRAKELEQSMRQENEVNWDKEFGGDGLENV